MRIRHKRGGFETKARDESPIGIARGSKKFELNANQPPPAHKRKAIKSVVGIIFRLPLVRRREATAEEAYVMELAYAADMAIACGISTSPLGRLPDETRNL